MAGSEKAVPSIPGERQEQVPGKVRYTKYLAGSVAVLTVTAIVSSFVLRSKTPGSFGQEAPQKLKKKTEKKEDKKKDRTEAADIFKPDATNYPFSGSGRQGIAGGTGYPVEWNGRMAGK